MLETLAKAFEPVIHGEFSAMASALLWSVAVILLRLSGLRLAPIPLTFFKSAVALVCFYTTILYLGLPLWPDLPPVAYGRLAISAILGISIADTLFVAALNRLGASLQAIADCIYAPSVAFVGFLMFGEGLNGWEVVGGALVVAGVLVGVGLRFDSEAPPRELLSGVALAAGAHVVMAVGILMVRDLYRTESVLWIAGYRFLVATAVLGLYAWWRGEDLWAGFRQTDLYKWTIPLSLLGPYLATVFWISGFKYTTPGRAAIYNQLSTVFVILLAWLVLHERLTPRRLAALALAGLGSLLVALS
ncbi:MAG: DMT family transporter [Vulcanimicrobiota bacterium]